MAFTNLTKSSNTFSNSSKNSTTFSGLDFLLKEDAFYLLLENGFKIILDQSISGKNTTTFTNLSK